MSSQSNLYHGFWEENKGILFKYFSFFLVIVAVFAGYLLLADKAEYIVLIIILIFFIVTVTRPRLALYQFIFVLFTNVFVSTDPVILLTDLSAVVVICAALLDLFLKGSLPKSFPRLFFSFVLILWALVVTAVLGNDPYLAIKPMGRVFVLLITFLSVYRLSRYVELKRLIIVFFWVSVFHSVITLTPLLLEGYSGRVFGFSPSTLDDLMMISLPIGLVLYLWADRMKGIKYSLGVLIVFVALLVTQSRLPIIFSVLLSIAVIYLSVKLARKKLETAKNEPFDRNPFSILRLIKHRIAVVLGSLVMAVAIVLLSQPELVKAVLARFEQLLTFTPEGTFRLRLVLWETALRVFWDHPLLGIGPGHFRTVHNLYHDIGFDPIYAYVKGLSAHNLFFHYLAETGLLGTSALLALFINQYRLSRAGWKKNVFLPHPEVHLILYLISILFLVTFFIEAAWMWGQIGFLFALFLALMVRSFDSTFRVK